MKWLLSPRADVALAVAFVAAAEAEVWLSDPDHVTHATVNALVALVWPGALLLRRQAPLMVLVVIMSALALYGVLGIEYFTGAQFVALLVATYSVAAHARRRVAIVGLVLAIAAGVTHSMLASTDAPVGNAIYPLVLLSAPWLAGRAQQVHQQRAVELERLNAEVARLAVADERARIARELHDAVAHSVNVAVIHAEAASALLDERPQDVREPLERIQQSGREALVEMRRMLGVLRHEDRLPTMSPPRVSDLPALVERVREAGLEVDYEIGGPARDLSPGLELNAYRIVQEALTNTLKHAAAARAWVHVAFTERALELEIADDGAGASAGSGRAGAGHGHVSLRERAALFGGQAETGPRPDGGWVVRARLPFDQDAP